MKHLLTREVKSFRGRSRADNTISTINYLIVMASPLLFLSIPAKAQAVCPLCTATVVGGLGISRILGIDDVITGVWLGGFVISIGMWLGDVLGRKKPNLPQPKLLAVLFFGTVLSSVLYLAGIVGATGNIFWGMDKIILGIIIGATVFLSAHGLDLILRKLNNGQVIIYYQKVIIPVFMLSVTSYIMHLITK